MHEGKASFLTLHKWTLTIATIGFLTYFNSLANGFVWDDFTQIIQSPSLHSFSNLNAFFSEASILPGAFYRPLQLSYLSLLYTLFGQHAFPFHLLQVTLHIVNAVLAFKIFSLACNKKVALFLALIFLVHPMTVESVAFISASSEVLYAFFGLSALYLMLKNNPPSSWTLFLVYSLLLLSLLSKESGVVFVALVVCTQLLKNKRIILLHIPFLASTLGIYLFLRIHVAHILYNPHSLDFIPIVRATLTERLVTMPKIVLFYFKTFFFPIDLAISQLWVVHQMTIADFYSPLLMLSVVLLIALGVACTLFRFRKKSFPFFLFFTFWFLSGMSILLQVFPLTMTVADRWFYVPMLGLLGMIGVTIQQIHIRNTILKTSLVICASLIIVGLMLRTLVRNTNWYNSHTLFTHDVKVSQSFLLENDIGIEYLEKKQYTTARSYFMKSATLFPYEVNLYNIGLTYAREGNQSKTNDYFHQAIDHYYGYMPDSSFARLLLQEKGYEAAREFLERKLETNRNDAYLIFLLAIANYKLGEKEEALSLAKKAYTIDPQPTIKEIVRLMSQNQPVDNY
ncbi:MAG: tetratricopeptide repeat protein [bacterium]|nr:tetratricopeptide repeat protein [bacterium]